MINDVVVGTLLYDARRSDRATTTDPGTTPIRRPRDFHPGAYDLTDFQVYDTGTTITFRAQTADLTPTFGSPLGAQLLDLYVTVPGVTPTSTAASFAGRQLPIGDRVEPIARGAGLRSAIRRCRPEPPLGTITISAHSISRYITFSVDKTALGGTPTDGWSYALTLTGQDGYSPDKPVQFAATPQDYAVRRLCNRIHRAALHSRSRLRAQGDGRADAAWCLAVRRTRLHQAQPGGDLGGHAVDASGAASRATCDSWCYGSAWCYRVTGRTTSG